MAKFHLTNKAKDDLTSIWIYTLETWSKEQANKYYSRIIASIQQIATDTRIQDKEYRSIHPGLFCRRCMQHLVFYHIVENNEIEVIRILHKRMDIVSKF